MFYFRFPILGYSEYPALIAGSEKSIRVKIFCDRVHTYFVQYFCNLLNEKLTNDLFPSVEEIKMEILESQKHFFTAQKNLLPPGQWKTMKAIAKKESITNMTSSEFLNFSSVAPTSARRSIEALIEKDMLLMEDGAIKVYNVFLSRYLETLES